MHILIVGGSTCGKSSLARVLIDKSKKKKTDAIVFDPFFVDGISDAQELWGAEQATSSKMKFGRMVNKSLRCLTVVDEASEWGKSSKFLETIASKFRHRGQKIIFICQNYTMLSPTIRNQCSHIYVFRTLGESCKSLCKEYGNIMKCVRNFKNGEYLYFKVENPNHIIKDNIFNDKTSIELYRRSQAA
jgi:ABC-type glutathione transport system ATPase component